MYLAAITSKANSSGSEDNRESNGSMSGVDELFESRIMFDIISRSFKEEPLKGMGMFFKGECIKITAMMPSECSKWQIRLARRLPHPFHLFVTTLTMFYPLLVS